jgi:hypothetical protein
MRFILILSLLFFFNISKSQPIKILIGNSSSEVEDYYKTLFSKKNNPYYITERTVSDDGDLILTASFALDDESFYKCIGTKCFFRRGNGIEKCYAQIVWGLKQYAYDHLEFIKDKFKYKEKNKWIFPYLDPDIESKYELSAEYFPKEDDSFVILYLISKKKQQ